MWSKIRSKLEKEHLAPSLRGHITYFATSYSKCPDHYGRAAILLDGKEIVSGSYCEQWSKVKLLPEDETLETRLKYVFPYMDNTAVKYGQFDQHCFYAAFQEFDNQSIEQSLESENMLVRILAILDKRVGKRRLAKIGDSIENEAEIYQTFYKIRVEAEKNSK